MCSTCTAYPPLDLRFKRREGCLVCVCVCVFRRCFVGFRSCNNGDFSFCGGEGMVVFVFSFALGFHEVLYEGTDGVRMCDGGWFRFLGVVFRFDSFLTFGALLY